MIVPHEDDEINVAGGVIVDYVKQGAEVVVVFTTNGDCFEPAYIRHKEAILSLRTLGVERKNIVFLGYPDQMDTSQNTWSDKNGMCETSGSKYGDDFRFRRDGYHSLLCKENFVGDIQDVILDFMPDIIFCVDFDSHSDHRRASLGFEQALGMILKREGNAYHPRVYKGFAYPTAFKGFRDFDDDINMTRFQREANNLFEMQNPYYRWENRVRFPVPKQVREYSYGKNMLYRALSKHKSQMIIQQAPCIINHDQIFWQRRTDNLLFGATISASSGNPSFLNDFMLFDLQDIMRGDRCVPNFDRGVWMPDEGDTQKTIRISFHKPVDICEICFYMGCNTGKCVKKVCITMDNGFTKNLSLTSDRVQSAKFPLQAGISSAEICILEADAGAVGFSEIEFLEPARRNVQFIKLLKDNHFCYRAEGVENMQLYLYDGYESRQVGVDSVAGAETVYLGGKKYLKLTLKENDKVYDCVPYEKQMGDTRKRFIRISNKIVFVTEYAIDRLLRKLRNTFKR